MKPSRLKENLEGYPVKNLEGYPVKTKRPNKLVENLLGHIITRFGRASPLVSPSPCLLVSLSQLPLSPRPLVSLSQFSPSPCLLVCQSENETTNRLLFLRMRIIGLLPGVSRAKHQQNCHSAANRGIAAWRRLVASFAMSRWWWRWTLGQ